MKELEEYLAARQKLSEALGIDEGDSIEDYRGSKFCKSETTITWIMDDELYVSDMVRGQFKKTDSLILALFQSCFSNDTYWAIFDSQNEVTDEEFEELENNLQ